MLAMTEKWGWLVLSHVISRRVKRGPEKAQAFWREEKPGYRWSFLLAENGT